MPNLDAVGAHLDRMTRPSSAPPFSAEFHTVGDVITPPYPGDRNDDVWLTNWAAHLKDRIGRVDAWGVLMQRPNGDTRLFGTNQTGLLAAAMYATRARVITLRRT